MKHFSTSLLPGLLILLLCAQAVAGPVLDICGSHQAGNHVMQMSDADTQAPAPSMHDGMHMDMLMAKGVSEPVPAAMTHAAHAHAPDAHTAAIDKADCDHQCGFCFSVCASVLPAEKASGQLPRSGTPVASYLAFSATLRIETLYRPPITA